MASRNKQIQQLSRQYFRLSFVDGAITPERVGGVLEYMEKHRPAHAAAILKAYHRLVAAEIARSQAIVEHAGSISAGAIDAIASSMTRKYGRTVTAVSRKNDTLLAGIRVRVGDDTYESSVASQLATLAASV